MGWLREMRKTKGMTACQTADRAGITQGYYTMIEIGKRMPSVEVAQKIAVTMDFDWRRFFG